MTDNFLGRLIQAIQARVAALVAQSIEDGIDQGARDAMRKFGMTSASDLPQTSNGSTIAESPKLSVPKNCANGIAGPENPPLLPPRKRGRPRKEVPGEDNN